MPTSKSENAPQHWIRDDPSCSSVCDMVRSSLSAATSRIDCDDNNDDSPGQGGSSTSHVHSSSTTLPPVVANDQQQCDEEQKISLQCGCAEYQDKKRVWNIRHSPITVDTNASEGTEATTTKNRKRKKKKKKNYNESVLLKVPSSSTNEIDTTTTTTTTTTVTTTVTTNLMQHPARLICRLKSKIHRNKRQRSSTITHQQPEPPPERLIRCILKGTELASMLQQAKSDVIQTKGQQMRCWSFVDRNPIDLKSVLDIILMKNGAKKRTVPPTDEDITALHDILLDRASQYATKYVTKYVTDKFDTSWTAFFDGDTLIDFDEEDEEEDNNSSSDDKAIYVEAIYSFVEYCLLMYDDEDDDEIENENKQQQQQQEDEKMQLENDATQAAVAAVEKTTASIPSSPPLIDEDDECGGNEQQDEENRAEVAKVAVVEATNPSKLSSPPLVDESGGNKQQGDHDQTAVAKIAVVGGTTTASPSTRRPDAVDQRRDKKRRSSNMNEPASSSSSVSHVDKNKKPSNKRSRRKISSSPEDNGVVVAVHDNGQEEELDAIIQHDDDKGKERSNKISCDDDVGTSIVKLASATSLTPINKRDDVIPKNNIETKQQQQGHDQILGEEQQEATPAEATQQENGNIDTPVHKNQSLNKIKDNQTTTATTTAASFSPRECSDKENNTTSNREEEMTPPTSSSSNNNNNNASSLVAASGSVGPPMMMKNNNQNIQQGGNNISATVVLQKRSDAKNDKKLIGAGGDPVASSQNNQHTPMVDDVGEYENSNISKAAKKKPSDNGVIVPPIVGDETSSSDKQQDPRRQGEMLSTNSTGSNTKPPKINVDIDSNGDSKSMPRKNNRFNQESSSSVINTTIHVKDKALVSGTNATNHQIEKDPAVSTHSAVVASSRTTELRTSKPWHHDLGEEQHLGSDNAINNDNQTAKETKTLIPPAKKKKKNGVVSSKMELKDKGGAAIDRSTNMLTRSDDNSSSIEIADGIDASTRILPEIDTQPKRESTTEQKSDNLSATLLTKDVVATDESTKNGSQIKTKSISPPDELPKDNVDSNDGKQMVKADEARGNHDSHKTVDKNVPPNPPGIGVRQRAGGSKKEDTDLAPTDKAEAPTESKTASKKQELTGVEKSVVPTQKDDASVTLTQSIDTNMKNILEKESSSLNKGASSTQAKDRNQDNRQLMNKKKPDGPPHKSEDDLMKNSEKNEDPEHVQSSLVDKRGGIESKSERHKVPSTCDSDSVSKKTVVDPGVNANAKSPDKESTSERKDTETFVPYIGSQQDAISISNTLDKSQASPTPQLLSKKNLPADHVSSKELQTNEPSVVPTSKKGVDDSMSTAEVDGIGGVQNVENQHAMPSSGMDSTNTLKLVGSLYADDSSRLQDMSLKATVDKTEETLKKMQKVDKGESTETPNNAKQYVPTQPAADKYSKLLQVVEDSEIPGTDNLSDEHHGRDSKKAGQPMGPQKEDVPDGQEDTITGSKNSLVSSEEEARLDSVGSREPQNSSKPAPKSPTSKDRNWSNSKERVKTDLAQASKSALNSKQTVDENGGEQLDSSCHDAAPIAAKTRKRTTDHPVPISQKAIVDTPSNAPDDGTTSPGIQHPKATAEGINSNESAAAVAMEVTPKDETPSQDPASTPCEHASTAKQATGKAEDSQNITPKDPASTAKEATQKTKTHEGSAATPRQQDGASKQATEKAGDSKKKKGIKFSAPRQQDSASKRATEKVREKNKEQKVLGPVPGQQDSTAKQAAERAGDSGESKGAKTSAPRQKDSTVEKAAASQKNRATKNSASAPRHESTTGATRKAGDSRKINASKDSSSTLHENDSKGAKTTRKSGHSEKKNATKDPASTPRGHDSISAKQTRKVGEPQNTKAKKESSAKQTNSTRHIIDTVARHRLAELMQPVDKVLSGLGWKIERRSGKKHFFAPGDDWDSQSKRLNTVRTLMDFLKTDTTWKDHEAIKTVVAAFDAAVEEEADPGKEEDQVPLSFNDSKRRRKIPRQKASKQKSKKPDLPIESSKRKSSNQKPKKPDPPDEPKKIEWPRNRKGQFTSNNPGRPRKAAKSMTSKATPLRKNPGRNSRPVLLQEPGPLSSSEIEKGVSSKGLNLNTVKETSDTDTEATNNDNGEHDDDSTSELVPTATMEHQDTRRRKRSESDDSTQSRLRRSPRKKFRWDDAEQVQSQLGFQSAAGMTSAEISTEESRIPDAALSLSEGIIQTPNSTYESIDNAIDIDEDEAERATEWVPLSHVGHISDYHGFQRRHDSFFPLKYNKSVSETRDAIDATLALAVKEKVEKKDPEVEKELRTLEKVMAEAYPQMEEEEKQRRSNGRPGTLARESHADQTRRVNKEMLESCPLIFSSTAQEEFDDCALGGDSDFCKGAATADQDLTDSRANFKFVETEDDLESWKEEEESSSRRKRPSRTSELTAYRRISVLLLKEMRTTFDFIERYNRGLESKNEIDSNTDDKHEESGDSDVSETEEEPLDEGSHVLIAGVDGHEEDNTASAGKHPRHRESRSQSTRHGGGTGVGDREEMIDPLDHPMAVQSSSHKTINVENSPHQLEKRQWTELSHIRLLADYRAICRKFKAFITLPTHGTVESLKQDVAQIITDNDIGDDEDEEILAEHRAYVRILRGYNGKADQERIEKNEHEEQRLNKVREFEYWNKSKKISPEEEELLLLESRPIRFVERGGMASTDRKKCRFGTNCLLCRESVDLKLHPNEKGNPSILNPGFQRKEFGDIDDSEEVANQPKKARRSRTAEMNKQKKLSLLRLKEMYCTLDFIERYNSGLIYTAGNKKRKKT